MAMHVKYVTRALLALSSTNMFETHVERVTRALPTLPKIFNERHHSDYQGSLENNARETCVHVGYTCIARALHVNYTCVTNPSTVMCSNERHQRDYRGSLGEDVDGNKCLNWDTVVTDNELEE